MSAPTRKAKSGKKPEPTRPPPPTPAEWAAFWAGQPAISGSRHGALTAVQTASLAGALWYGPNPNPEMVEVQRRAALETVAEVGPRDALEGMLAAQLVATHTAAMECFRRAHLPEQTVAGRELGLKYGEKLVRSFAALVEALDRHRGKGQPQVVRVERVTVEAGGQAIVGAVAQGGGSRAEREDRCHAKQLAHAPEPALRGQNPQREPVPVARGRG